MNLYRTISGRPVATIAVLAAFVCSSAPAAVRFSPPDPDSSTAPQVQALKEALDQNNASDAALRIESLLKEHADELMAVDGGGVRSVYAAVTALPPEQQRAIAPAYGQKYDDDARAAFDAAAQDPKNGAAAFYAIVKRYPLSGVVPKAFATAADRAAAVGDLPAARSLYRLAKRSGWTPDDARARRIDAIDRLCAETGPVEHPAAGPRAVAALFTGYLPFDATWYGGPVASAVPRYFPFASAGITYLTTPHRIYALREGGTSLWSSPLVSPFDGAPRPDAAGADPDAPPPPPAPVPNAPRRKRQMRGPGTFRPAELGGTDDASWFGPVPVPGNGEARLLIVRQPTADKNYGLAALRASDGKLLWASEADDATRDFSFAPAPLACGRTVFALACDTSGAQGLIVALALDATSGRLMWKEAIGSYAATGISPHGHQVPAAGGVGAFAQSAGLAADDDLVLFTPNIGFATALGRFDGKLRWSRPYPLAPPDPAERRPEPRVLPNGQRVVPPSFTATPRFDNRPFVAPAGDDAAAHDVLVLAPQDSNAVCGLDIRTGETLWSTTDYPRYTLLGVHDGSAVLAAGDVVALDAQTGQPKWKYVPPGPAITGPPTMVGALIYVPVAGATVVLSAQNGQPATAPGAKLPTFRAWATSEVGQQALSADNVAGAFGLPAPPSRPK